MAAGMMPSAIGIGEGAAFRAPMAIAVIGGLLASTMLSLVFVPAVFTLMDDLQKFFGRIFGRFIGARDEPPEFEATNAPVMPTVHRMPHPPMAAE